MTPIKLNQDFGIRECPSCGVEVDANQNYCPICSYAFPHHMPRQKFMRIGGAIIMLAILLYWLLSAVL